MDPQKAWVAAPAPRVDADRLTRLLAEQWGLEGRLRRLYAERDLNLQLTTPAGERFLLKIAHPDTDPAALALQDRALVLLAKQAEGLPAPHPVPSRSGDTLVSLENPRGVARLLTWLEGEAVDLAAAPDESAEAAGACLARLGLALRKVAPDGAPARLPWDLQGFQDLAPLCRWVSRADLRPLVERTLERHRVECLPILAILPRQLIHNDLNPDNLLFDPADPGRVTGIIDFGDMVAAPVVCDLAIAGAYTLNPAEEDPERRLVALVRGFHRVRPLDSRELEVLPALVAARLATTVLIQGARVAAEQDPDGTLAGVVATAGMRLGRLHARGFEALGTRLRAACAAV